MIEEQFSVYQFFADNAGYELVAKFVTPEDAVRIYNGLVTSLGAKLGTTERIIITDGGDSTILEWCYGQGITWPKNITQC